MQRLENVGVAKLCEIHEFRTICVPGSVEPVFELLVRTTWWCGRFPKGVHLPQRPADNTVHTNARISRANMAAVTGYIGHVALNVRHNDCPRGLDVVSSTNGVCSHTGA